MSADSLDPGHPQFRVTDPIPPLTERTGAGIWGQDPVFGAVMTTALPDANNLGPG